MIKLPKCPHCGKLMVPYMSRATILNEDLLPESRMVVTYLCPEALFGSNHEPVWVEIEETLVVGPLPKM